MPTCGSISHRAPNRCLLRHHDLQTLCARVSSMVRARGARHLAVPLARTALEGKRASVGHGQGLFGR